MLFVTQQMSMMLLLAVLKILSFNGSGGSPSGVNVRDELNDERVCQICESIMTQGHALACFQYADTLLLASKHAEGESTEKVQFFKDQNEKCLRFITFLSTNRLNKAMIDRKRSVKRLFLRY